MIHHRLASSLALPVLTLAGVLVASGCPDGSRESATADSGLGTTAGSTTELQNPTTSAASTTSETKGASEATSSNPSSTTGSSSEPETTGTGGDGICGNGTPEPSEECDDGNAIDGDACTNACTLFTCGDGIVGPGEQCDDKNDVDDDHCTNKCILTFCGDGEVQATRGESCDDGSESTTCNANCTKAQCGDKVLNTAAGEECDDGNDQNSDACSKGCVAKQVLDMAMGYDHTCILLTGGNLHCWGHNSFGQLGRGNSQDQGDQPGEVPGPPVLPAGSVVQAAAAIDHTCAVLDSGDLQCWGRNHFGQLGYGNTATLGAQPGDLPTPNVVVGVDVVAVSLGEWHTCALTKNNRPRCWGRGNQGALGYGAPSNLLTPNLLDVPGIADAQELSLGAFTSCVLRPQGTIQCWGNNEFGQLGQGHTQMIGDQDGEMPPPAIVLGGVATQIRVGYVHACALMQNGQVRCWGHGQYGKLGTGDQDNVGDNLNDMPPKDVNLGGPAVEIVAGGNHSCARMATGKIKCWGRGAHGSLGYASTNDVLADNQSPPQDVDLGGEAKRLWSHLGRATCALLVDDTLRCWGLNANGQLGYGHTSNIGDDESPASAGPVPF